MKEEHQHESNWMMASGWSIKIILQKINTKYWKKTKTNSQRGLQTMKYKLMKFNRTIKAKKYQWGKPWLLEQ